MSEKAQQAKDITHLATHLESHPNDTICFTKCQSQNTLNGNRSPPINFRSNAPAFERPRVGITTQGRHCH